MARRWNYSGDVDLEYGGLFWREAGAHEYVEAVRVTPCSDAGGPNNVFHVESGSIYMPRERYGAALDTCGYKVGRAWETGAQVIDGTGKALDARASRALIVDAFACYHGVERDSEYMLRIGKVDPGASGWGSDCEPDFVLRAGSSLKNFVRREFL